MPATPALRLVIADHRHRTRTKFATLSQRGVFDRSDQINQNSRAVTVPPRGTGQTGSKASLYDVERSGSDRARGTKAAKLSLWVRRCSGQVLVEPDGIEPTTSCLQSTRSPN